MLRYRRADNEKGDGGRCPPYLTIPDNGVMVRSASGNSYARIHLTNVSCANPKDASSQTSWTFELEIAPEK